LPKLLWLKRHLPEAWARYGLALDLTDFLTWRATDVIAVSACTVTCKWTYLNHAQPGWQQDLLDQVGLSDLKTRARLPKHAVPIASPAGRLSARSADAMGLSRGCMVGVGLIDAHAGGVGLLGALEGNELNRRLALIAGTSSCHMAASPEPRPIPGVWGPYFGAMLPGLWLTEGGQSATGALLDLVLQWHAEGRALGADGHARVIARVGELLAAEGPQLAHGLMVLPDFHGNRSPLADPAARGVVRGLTLDASFDSLARLYYAAAIGIAFGTRHILDALNAKGYAIDTLHLTGGHAANPWLVQLYADATGCWVALPVEQDSVLLGTAIVAATAAGLHDSITASARAMAHPGPEIAPDPANTAYFDQQYRAFLLMQKHEAELRSLSGV
jgi:FGGY-family pentulose kinase